MFYPENDYRSYLMHGTKGKHWTWAKHKYLAVKNGRYIYPKDNSKSFLDDYYAKQEKWKERVDPITGLSGNDYLDVFEDYGDKPAGFKSNLDDKKREAIKDLGVFDAWDAQDMYRHNKVAAAQYIAQKHRDKKLKKKKRFYDFFKQIPKSIISNHKIAKAAKRRGMSLEEYYNVINRAKRVKSNPHRKYGAPR